MQRATGPVPTTAETVNWGLTTPFVTSWTDPHTTALVDVQLIVRQAAPVLVMVVADMSLVPKLRPLRVSDMGTEYGKL